MIEQFLFKIWTKEFQIIIININKKYKLEIIRNLIRYQHYLSKIFVILTFKYFNIYILTRNSKLLVTQRKFKYQNLNSI